MKWSWIQEPNYPEVLSLLDIKVGDIVTFDSGCKGQNAYWLLLHKQDAPGYWTAQLSHTTGTWVGSGKLGRIQSIIVHTPDWYKAPWYEGPLDY